MEIAMIKEQIVDCLMVHGYCMLSGTTDNVAVGYKEENGIKKAVCFINLKDGIFHKQHYVQLRMELVRVLNANYKVTCVQEECSQNQTSLDLLISNVHFTENQQRSFPLLILFYTDYIDMAKRLVEEEDYFWIIDARQKRLMVYEPEQTTWAVRGAFDELIHPLEDCIERVPQKQSIKKHITEYFLVTYILIGVNLFVFFVLEQGIFRGRLDWLMLGANYAPAVIKENEFYRLFTSMFLHADIEHLFNNMLLLCYIGRLLEEQLGKIRHLFVYFLSGIIAGLFSIGYNTHIGQPAFCIGASGAIFGLTGAMAVFVLWKQGRMAQINRRQMLIMVLLSLYGGFVETNVDNAAHIGGLLAGAAVALLLTLVHQRKAAKKREEGTSV